MFEIILELIYPTTCGICGKIEKSGLCKKCEIMLKPLLKEKIEFYTNTYYQEHFYLFQYQDFIRQLLISYKFHSKSYLYQTFSRIILNSKKNCDFLKCYDIIIPVPISKKRKRTRGYNQSELIAKQIVKEMPSLKLELNCLKKVTDNKPQSSLNQEQRMQNVKNVYQMNQIEKIKGKRIVLLDDIYTTGSTANACSEILNKAGAKKIGVFTIAKD